MTRIRILIYKLVHLQILFEGKMRIKRLVENYLHDGGEIELRLGKCEVKLLNHIEYEYMEFSHRLNKIDVCVRVKLLMDF